MEDPLKKLLDELDVAKNRHEVMFALVKFEKDIEVWRIHHKDRKGKPNVEKK